MKYRFFISMLALSLVLLLGGCRRAPTPEQTETPLVTSDVDSTSSPVSPTSTPQAYPAPTQGAPPSATPYPGPLPTSTSQSSYPGPITSQTPLSPSQTALASTATVRPPTATIASPTETATLTGPTAYPGPPSTPTPYSPYPGPIIPTPTAYSAYPGPGTPTAVRSPTAITTGRATGSPVPSITRGPSPTPGGSITPPAIPIEIPPVPAATPPPPGSLVRIWHSWSSERAQAFDVVIDAFQDVYPDIHFDITIIPQVDLRDRYEAETYNGAGPSLLLAPAEWGPLYFESQLVADLSAYTSEEFLAQINPAALGTGQYQGALISLPISQSGIVLYRNLELVPTAPQTFDELIDFARSATRGGNLGVYFDRGALYSAGNISGLGGSLMDPAQGPAFNSPAGLVWLDLMADYDVAGAVGLNTNRDLDLFSSGRIGFIIEGTWQIATLEGALGTENFAIDPWPEYGSGHLSGFVQTEAVFLNPNTVGGDQAAAMLFMGYLLTADVQQYLAEFGMIPTVTDANPRPFHVAEAAIALEGGTAYPPVADPHVLTAFWEGLEIAIQRRFTYRDDAQSALLSAEEHVLERLRDLNP